METSSVSSGAPLPPSEPNLPTKRRGWKRYLVYALAVLGVLFVALMGLVFYVRLEEKNAAIPETATIESTMAEVFGRYSDEHKGWLYLADNKRSYVMRVVHRASIDEKREGDGLYFIASGAPLDEHPGALYGVFYLYKDASQNGAVQRSALLYENDEASPLTPERVFFEALSKQQWAWVIKEVVGVDEEDKTLTVTNLMLAPHDGEIKEIARFSGQLKFTPAGGCATAEADYVEWQRYIDKLNQTNSVTPTASGASEVPSEDDAEVDTTEPDAPARCDDLNWTYRTDSPKDGSITSLHISQKGVSAGEKVADKKWKVMFDTKSFEYRVPPELK